MKKKNKISISWVVALVLVVSCMGAVALTAIGANSTSTDPLVSLSYLNSIFKERLMEDVRYTVESEVSSLEAELDQSIYYALNSFGSSNSVTPTHETATIPEGSSFQIPAGADFLLISGTAAPKESGLTDTTLGQGVAVGTPLVENHLYVASVPVYLQAKTTVTVLLSR